MWCLGELTPEYIERMENVLWVYERPWNRHEPVVCLDEKSTQLLAERRFPLSAQPGGIAKQDSEYIRCGTGNIFCGVEPKAGRHFTWVTKNRKAPEFARTIWKLNKAYPRVKTIHLNMDNLNTHREKSLVDYYGSGKGRRLWKRFAVHYTPKHGNWLNQAEIEIGLLSRQCLGHDRIANLDDLARRAKAWNQKVNRKRLQINWTFTTTKARKTLKYCKDKLNCQSNSLYRSHGSPSWIPCYIM